MDILTTIATWLVPLIIAIVFHEVAHGLVARRLGDPTAAAMGRLTLNPLKHIDPFGTVILPMALAIASRRVRVGQAGSGIRNACATAPRMSWGRSRAGNELPPRNRET